MSLNCQFLCLLIYYFWKVGSRLLIPNSAGGHNMTWTDYHPLEDIYSYLDYLQEKYDFVTTQSIGKSYEGNWYIITWILHQIFMYSNKVKLAVG